MSDQVNIDRCGKRGHLWFFETGLESGRIGCPVCGTRQWVPLGGVTFGERLRVVWLSFRDHCRTNPGWRWYLKPWELAEGIWTWGRIEMKD